LLCHDNIKIAFQQFYFDDSLPQYVHTDFDDTLISDPNPQYLHEHGCIVCVSPSSHKDENGLVETA
jgi:hypothetical protein